MEKEAPRPWNSDCWAVCAIMGKYPDRQILKLSDFKPWSNIVVLSGTGHYFSLAQRTDIYCPYIYNRIRLSVGLGHALQLVLLLDGVAVGAALGRVDQFVREALRNGLDVAEGSLPRPSAEQPDGLEVNKIKWNWNRN